MDEDNWEVDVERGDGCQVFFSVRVPEDDVEEQRRQSINELKQQIDEPGFRKGRVPDTIIKEKYDHRLKRTLLEALIPRACEHVYETHDVRPVSEPTIEDFDINGEFFVKGHVDERPRVDVEDGAYRGLALEQEDHAITSEAVDERIDELRSSKASLEPIPITRPIQEGDFVRVDFEGFDDEGNPVEGTKSEDTVVEIGSERFLPEIEEGLVGASEGDQRTIPATFPDDFVDEELAGETLDFRVRVKEIQEERKPELEDEEFLESLDVESVDALREKVRDRMRDAGEQSSRQDLSEQIYEQLLETYDLTLPESLVERELESIMDNYRSQVERQGRDFEEFLEEQEQDLAELKAESREQAERRIRLTLIFQAIAEREDVEVTDDELEEHLEELSSQYGTSPDELREHLSDQQLSSIRHELRDEKVLDFLVEEADVEIVEPEASGDEPDPETDEAEELVE